MEQNSYPSLISHDAYQQFNNNGVANTLAIDENFKIIYANHKELAFSGYNRDEYIGHNITDFYKELLDKTDILKLLQNKQPFFNHETCILCKDGSTKYVLLSSDTYNDSSDVTYTYLFGRDITKYKKNENLLSYLNTAAEELARTRDTRSALNKISKLIVPKFANWFTIELLNNGKLDLLLLEHEDPEQIKWAHEYRKNYPANLNDNSGIAIAVKTGKPSFIPIITTQMILAGITDPVKLESILKMNLQSVISVAMLNNEVIMGIVTFVSTTTGNYFDEADLRFAQNFANHIGLALQNARLNEEAAAEIQQRKQVEEKLKKSEELFRLMAESMPQKVFLTDAEGRQSYINSQWEHFTGYPLAALDGEKLRSLIHPDDLDNNMMVWREALKTGEAFTYEHRFLSKDDNYLWHLTRALPLKNDDGEIIMWLGTLTDIDSQKQKEEKKDEFISIASHELRTPLTTIKAFIQLAQRAIDPAERTYNFIDKANKQIDRLERLITDLLDVSKINAGKMVYNMQEFNFSDALKETVQNVQHTAPDHEIIIEASANVLYKGDILRIEEVINNFLTNAIKYSPDANKVIVKSVIDGDNLIVSVQDFGIGIAKDNLGDLFERFYRVDNTAMRFQGLGLGLFISAEIIKRHNGSFWIESEPGKGSTFYFSLPIKGKKG